MKTIVTCILDMPDADLARAKQVAASILKSGAAAVGLQGIAVTVQSATVLALQDWSSKPPVRTIAVRMGQPEPEPTVPDEALDSPPKHEIDPELEQEEPGPILPYVEEYDPEADDEDYE